MRKSSTYPSCPVVNLLRDLIRFDTTNPPGNEGPCVAFLEQLFQQAGLETQRIAKEIGRPNLIVRLPGRGDAPPLLLYGHVDVVTTAHQSWSHPPFEGRIVDDCVWGRGALDMKNGVAMMTAAVLRARTEGLTPAGDVLFAALVDEEAGGHCGARFLVESHRALFDGVRYAVGEFGGFPVRIGRDPYYMIQVGEKKPCWMEVRIRGPAGHGARPMRGGAMARLGQLLAQLDRCRLPIHVTPITRRMVETIAGSLPKARRLVVRGLLDPRTAGSVLRLLGRTGTSLEPLFRNTVSPTLLRGGEKPNVIPSEIVLGLDGRLLPGFEPEHLIAELRSVIGRDLELDVVLYDEGPSRTDFGLFATLGKILRESNPSAVPVPFLLPASTDARFFAQLGIQTYGFTPMNLPTGFDFFATVHAANERIPIEAVEFGADAIYRLLEVYGTGEPIDAG